MPSVNAAFAASKLDGNVLSRCSSVAPALKSGVRLCTYGCSPCWKERDNVYLPHELREVVTPRPCPIGRHMQARSESRKERGTYSSDLTWSTNWKPCKTCTTRGLGRSSKFRTRKSVSSGSARTHSESRDGLYLPDIIHTAIIFDRNL